MDVLICGQCGSRMFRVDDGCMCEHCKDYVSDISIMDEEEYMENYSEQYDPSDDYRLYLLRELSFY